MEKWESGPFNPKIAPGKKLRKGRGKLDHLTHGDLSAAVKRYLDRGGKITRLIVDSKTGIDLTNSCHTNPTGQVW